MIDLNADKVLAIAMLWLAALALHVMRLIAF